MQAAATPPRSRSRRTCAPNLFVVANDEDNVLRAYRLGEPAPVGEWDLNSFLKTAPKNEVDIEGVARIGDVGYWISSHGS